MPDPRPICSIPACPDPVKTLASGWCSAHYQRARSHEGDPLGGRAYNGEVLAYFNANVNLFPSDCRIWPYSDNGKGYGLVWLGGRKQLVHRLACEARWGPPATPDLRALHGPCHMTSCWNGAHTEWGTAQDNNGRDKVRDGTLNLGIRNGSAVLTPDIVREIRRRYAAGGVSQTALAREFNVTQTPISRIIRRITWTGVE